MKPRNGLVAAMLVVLASPAGAEVYRNVDAYGNVTFSDEPSDGSEAIEVKPVTTVTLPKPMTTGMKAMPVRSRICATDCWRD